MLVSSTEVFPQNLSLSRPTILVVMFTGELRDVDRLVSKQKTEIRHLIWHFILELPTPGLLCLLCVLALKITHIRM